jgi:hypothetical protein
MFPQLLPQQTSLELLQDEHKRLVLEEELLEDRLREQQLAKSTELDTKEGKPCNPSLKIDRQ